MADSARRPLSPSFVLHTTNGSRSLVEQAGATIVLFETMDGPLLAICRDLYSLHGVEYVAGFMSPPPACPSKSWALESMTDHHCEFPLSERPNVTPSRL
jgi:hypothetical protein